ncbi:hypothetical protein RF11_05350 [Thelohanellus kitauei]|uniref:Uncharacterized protein n=1 Tax=Thelohanellus kitauei TaxID=669202 RepID=A0A0C2J6S4_THEKT|nr:hypothetical protein RF11_05350 [Thelohanellus kitauei]
MSVSDLGDAGHLAFVKALDHPFNEEHFCGHFVFHEKNEVEHHKRNITIITLKERFHMLADVVSLYTPNLPDDPFALFIELINSDVAKTEFSSMSISQICIKGLVSYLVISETVLPLLIHFEQHVFAKLGFLAFYLTSLGIELRFVLAKTIPRIAEVLKQKQAQPSH